MVVMFRPQLQKLWFNLTGQWPMHVEFKAPWVDLSAQTGCEPLSRVYSFFLSCHEPTYNGSQIRQDMKNHPMFLEVGQWAWLLYIVRCPREF